MSSSAADDPVAAGPRTHAGIGGRVIKGLGIGAGVVGLLVVVGAALRAWGGIVHGHPAYLIALVITLVAAVGIIVWWRRRANPPRGWRLAGAGTLLIVWALWCAGLGWASPHTAVAPALEAMTSDDVVRVADSATRIVLIPTGHASTTGVVFQPGALVDARAYAAVLRPIAAAGHPVVIVKQPFGIAFLATGALREARQAVPDVTGWVLAGHSLGGTVAAMQADAADEDAHAPAVGLLLWASYPAGDVSTSLTVPVASISGTSDGLATPAKIEASRADLPVSAQFIALPGVSHAQFGAYGPQSGDGTPTVGDDVARSLIAEASLRFVEER